MPTIASSSSSFSLQNSDVLQSQAGFFTLVVRGLKPNTKHDLYVESILFNWAAKQDGKDLGADLISDENGVLRFGFLFEEQYEGSYAFDADSTNASQSLAQSPDGNAPLVRSSKLLELKAQGSYMRLNLPTSRYIIAGHTNRSEFHGH